MTAIRKSALRWARQMKKGGSRAARPLEPGPLPTPQPPAAAAEPGSHPRYQWRSWSGQSPRPSSGRKGSIGRCRRSRPEALTCCAGVDLGNGAPQDLPIADQGVEPLRHTRLGRHPLPQQAFKARHIQLRQQQAKGGIRWRLVEIRAEEAVERLAMAFGESLDADQRALAAENRQDRTSSIHH